MPTDFNTTFEVENDVLGVSFNNEDTPILTDGDGVLAPTENLYEFNLDSKGTLSADDRVGELPQNPLAVLWVGSCTIYEYKDTVDPITFQSTYQLTPILVNEPCKLSFTREPTAAISNGAAQIEQFTTLFIRPDIVVKAGSVIEVTQRGVTTKYKRSGLPAIYSNHQEIALELYDNET